MKKKNLIIIAAAVLALIAVTVAVIIVKANKKPETAKENVTEAAAAISEAVSNEGSNSKAYSDGAKYGSNLEGSAIYPEGTTAVITIAASSKSDKWDEASLKADEARLQTALDFISREAKEKYGKKVNFANGKEDLTFKYTYTGNDDIGQLVYDDYNGLLNDFADKNIDAEAIRSKYKADGIAYVFLMDGTGENTASVHLAADDAYTYNEAAFIYRFDCNSEEGEECAPSQYAHEILKLFGAVDLSEPDAQNGYTTALDNVVRSEYANDIMYTTLDSELAENQKEIQNEITDITAYTIGLKDDFKELADNKSFVKKYKCGFVDNISANTKDGSDYSEYEDDPAWSEEKAGALSDTEGAAAEGTDADTDNDANSGADALNGDTSLSDDTADDSDVNDETVTEETSEDDSGEDSEESTEGFDEWNGDT